MFAKLFGPDDDQILVMLDEDDEGQPEVAFIYRPNKTDNAPDFIRQCKCAITFEDSDAGRATAQQTPDNTTEEKARAIVEASKDETFRKFPG